MVISDFNHIPWVIGRYGYLRNMEATIHRVQVHALKMHFFHKIFVSKTLNFLWVRKGSSKMKTASCSSEIMEKYFGRYYIYIYLRVRHQFP